MYPNSTQIASPSQLGAISPPPRGTYRTPMQNGGACSTQGSVGSGLLDEEMEGRPKTPHPARGVVHGYAPLDPRHVELETWSGV